MKISQYDRVMLKDGKNATIVEVLEEDTAYIADVDLPGSDSVSYTHLTLPTNSRV